MVSGFALCAALLVSISGKASGDGIFLTYPVTGGKPWVIGEPGLIRWKAVIEAASTAFPPTVQIDLMSGPHNAASVLRPITSAVDPRAENYTWPAVPEDVPANATGHFIRIGTQSTGFAYGSDFAITADNSTETSASSTEPAEPAATATPESAGGAPPVLGHSAPYACLLAAAAGAALTLI